MRQLVTQCLPDSFVIPIPIVRIRSQAQLDDFAAVAVQPEGARLVRGVLGGIHLREEGDGEAVGGHGGADAGVVAEAGEEAEGFLRVGEVVEWEESVEGVLGGVLGFAPVAGFGRCGGFYGGWRARGGEGGDGGDFGGGGG